MKIHDFAESRRLSLRQVMDFTSDVNPVGPSSMAKHAIRKGAKDLIFPPDESVRQLKRYICKKEQVGEESIIFGQGMHHILSALIEMLRPVAIAVVWPISHTYGQFLAERDVKIVATPPTEEWCGPIDLESLVRTAGNADMLLLANPHDVTGTTLSTEEMVFLIKEMDRLGKTLLIDESYIDYSQPASPVHQAVASRGTVIMRSFSLFHALAGLPIGYALGAAALIAKAKDLIALPRISSLAHAAAYASLKDKGHRLRTLRFIEEEKRFIVNGLNKASAIAVSNTPCNFLLLRIIGQIAGLKDALQKKAILIDEYIDRSGAVYMKFPVKSHKFNARLIKALKSVIESSSAPSPQP